MPDSSQIAPAVARLDPESRALIELSARRGLSDREIGEVLGVDAQEVHRRRDRATDDLAGALKLKGSEERRALREQLAQMDASAWEQPGRDRDGRRRRQRRMAAAGAAVLVGIAAVVAVVLIAGGGKEGGTESGTGGGGGPSRAAAPAKGPVVRMARLRGTRGRGTAQLVRRGGRVRLRLRITRLLPPQGGGYAVWLFNAPSGARRLAFTRSTSIVRELALPGGYRRYRFVDVSREVPGDPAHSGLSLLRASIRRLEPRRG